MTEPKWEYERCGEWTFRTALYRANSPVRKYVAEARRGDFVNPNCIFDVMAGAIVQFEFGRTREEAIRKLKAECLS